MNAHARDFRPPLPDAIEAAEALLGAILVSNDAYWRVAGFLKPHHFPEKIHALVYETAGTMITEGRAVNPITIKPYLPADQLIGDVPLFAYVVRLASEAVTISGAYEYGRAIIECGVVTNSSVLLRTWTRSLVTCRST